MKKLLFITLSLLLLSNNIVKAEENKKFNIALIGFPSISWMKPTNDILKYDGLKANLSYGLIFDKNFDKNFAFSTGFNVNYAGGKLSEEFVLSNSDIKDTFKTNTNYKLQYVELPLMLKMRTNEIGYITYYANVGLGLGMNLRSSAEKEHENYKGDLLSTNNIKDYKEEINFFRPSFIIGAGVQYSLGGNASIIGGINFNNGLMDVLSDDNRAAINNYLSLNVGIMF